MTKQTGSDALNLLKSLASAWSAGRGCTIDPDAGRSGSTSIISSGPGFLYQWNQNTDPVRISFVPDREREIAIESPEHLLFIAYNDGVLYLQIPDHSTFCLKVETDLHRQRIDELVTETRNIDPLGDETLVIAIITAAQRFVSFSYSAFLGGLNNSESPKDSSRKRFSTDLHEWLSAELRNSVKLGDAAKHFKKSPRQLIRVLKETTGTGFAEHLTMHRLILARSLLMRTDGSVMEIARQSGFNSREQFIRSFSKAFNWTPLQFRKAWNRAALSNSDLQKLCRISDKEPVRWLESGQSCPAKSEPPKPKPQTLVVSNALHGIVELFSTDSMGRSTRIGVLDRGAMIFINRDTSGSCWRVLGPESNFARSFVTPEDHAIATITPDLKS